MLVGGKFAKPIASRGFVHSEHLTTRLNSPITLIQAPAGCLLTESLAAILEESDRQAVWLRFGWEDFDPATCLLSLIEAFQVVGEKVGALTLEKMRQLPGHLKDWPGLFAQFGHEVGESIAVSTALVLENLHCLVQYPQTLALLGKHFLPALPDQVKVTLITQKNLPSHALPKQPEIVKAQHLRLSPVAIKCMFQASESISEKAYLRQAVRLMEGSPVGLAGICTAGQLLGEAYMQEVLRRETTRAGLCARIARDWLGTLDEGDRQAVYTLISLGYNHPTIHQSQTGKSSLPPSPWALELNEGWIRPHSLWLTSLETALRTHSILKGYSIQPVADYLCRSGSTVTGIGMQFASGSFTRAADYLAQNVDEMLSLGQWDLLRYWLERLPESMLVNRPRLLHAAGEIKSAQGDLAGASDDFQRAGEQYFRLNEPAGNVISLLALSTLAARQGKTSQAWLSAYKALQIAQSQDMPQQESRAELQVGLLALRAGDLHAAIQHLERAGERARIAGDAALFKRVDELHTLAREQERRQQQRQQQHQLYLAAQQEERLLLERVQQVFQASLHLDGTGQGSSGRTQAEPALNRGDAASTDNLMSKEGLRSKLSAWLRRGLAHGVSRKTDHYAIDGHQNQEGEVYLRLNQPVIEVANLTKPTDNYTESNIKTRQTPASPPASKPLTSTIIYPIAENSKAPRLAVYCLGNFQVFEGDTLVENWSSRKAQSIFKYLLTYNQSPISKDILMEVFWPEADAESARRNLHQAIYVLRQALKIKTSDIQWIRFDNDGYRLNPEVDLWMDHVEFEKHYQVGLRHERKDKIDEAMNAYQVARDLYQDHYLTDELYEEWAQPRRQYLWQNYLYLANRLAQHHLAKNEISDAMTISQRILSWDECQEEAHQALMRCYLARGQRHLAIHQYQTCVRMLKNELGVSPSIETNKIYENIISA